jgi:hypothetical protein
MKKNILSIATVCLTIISCERSKITFDQIIDLDTAKVTSYNVTMSDPPPIDPDFWITNTKFVERLTNKFTNLDSLADENTLTKILFINAWPVDSILVLKNSLDNYSFVKNGTAWQIKSFEIKSTNFTLTPLSVGLTSGEVFKLLNSQVNKSVGDGQLLLFNEGDKKTRITLSFSDDKLTSIRL